MSKIYKFNYHWLNELSKHKDMLDNDTRILVTYLEVLQQENKQLKEELENDIDRYEDTISYQLGFDKGKEYLQQKIDKAKEYTKKYESIKAYYEYVDEDGYDEYNYDEDFKEELLEILGDKE